MRKTVIGLSRDLRGIAFAFNTKISYMMFFDWIYPAYTPILHRAVEIWYSDPQVIIYQTIQTKRVNCGHITVLAPIIYYRYAVCYTGHNPDIKTVC